MSDLAYVTGGYINLAEMPDPFLKLPSIAERLGVKPNTTNGGTVFRMKNGDTYDLFDLLNAFLDKVETAERAL